jgi:hypothetical protein
MKDKTRRRLIAFAFHSAFCIPHSAFLRIAASRLSG